jgi:hypothetical protein
MHDMNFIFEILATFVGLQSSLSNQFLAKKNTRKLSAEIF